MGCDPTLEAELAVSWDMMVRFYERALADTGWEYLAPLRDVVVGLRTAGYDRELRAGQSMHTFIVSRSRVHGMQDDHAWVALSADGRRQILKVSARLPSGTVAFDAALDGTVDPRLAELLDTLCAEPING